MKALRFEKTGSIDELQIREVPLPIPLPGSLLIEVKAAGLNPSDAENVLGRMRQTKPPRTPGRDFAGTIVAGTKAYAAGTEVFGSGGSLGFDCDGSHAEFIAVPAEAVRPKPLALTFEQAATVGVPYITASHAIMEVAALQEGETILITGTTGAVGDAAARIAKRMAKAKVIGTARRHTDAVRLKLLDYVDALADLSSGAISLPEQIQEETEGRGVDVVFDLVGGPLFESCLKCLALRGRQVAIASNPDPRVTFNLVEFYQNESRLIGVDSIQLSFENSGRILGNLLPYFESGELGPLEDPVPVGFASVLSVYRELAEGVAKAKYVFV
ncbi:MAG: zinc-binding alcohol dehydrogenase family protein, partial [Verrucomicrobia bacterium]|nr:zinc-binding alcohol dehydrogenase family protein [Verrucomicrobiota bacterium]